MALLYRKMKPKPTGKPPTAGPIQCSRGYDVQAKMKRPMGMDQQENIIGMSLASAGGLTTMLLHVAEVALID